MKFDAADYTISVQRMEVDGEILFRAQVREFPDVEVYEHTSKEAYAGAIRVITELAKLAREMGHSVPAPYVDSDEGYSGRVTLRMPKTLHQKISVVADQEQVSLNQYIVFVLASSVATQRFDFVRRGIVKQSLLKFDDRSKETFSRGYFRMFLMGKFDLARAVPYSTSSEKINEFLPQIITAEVTDRPFGKVN